MLRKGIITIEKHENCNNISVSFWGFQEGSGCPCDNEEEVKKEVEHLIKRHGDKYSLEITDKRVKQRTLC